MINRCRNWQATLALFLLFMVYLAPGALAVPLPGGTLDPLTIPKYAAPLVIPPVMPSMGVVDNYAIAVKQFKQQILPTPLPATTVWSYGNAADNVPAIAPSPTSTFNYPALTIEAISGTPVKVRWVNGLVDNTGKFLPHLLPVDQTVMFANPAATGCRMGLPNRTDCATDNAAPYTGPVPMSVHVHGAHVDPHSDGFANAWWLPAANNIPAGYAKKGSFFDDSTGTNPGTLGYADFRYRNDQPASTVWYHDHTMGMTRSNVYAGPAGFWLVRGGVYDGATDNVTVGKPAAVLPGPAPVAGNTLAALNTPGNPVRNAVREIPIAIQDRSFNADGSLFYPASRTFFDGFTGPYSGSLPISTDIAPIANVEAFFNTMVVNGGTWPTLDVAPALYRFRLLNGCNSRMLNLSLKNMTDNTELPFYQIGAEQGFLPLVVQIKTGFTTVLPGDNTIPAPVANGSSALQALLMANAERADVIVDFRGIPNGTVIRMRNTGADMPFQGFPILALADDNTTGQVMQFVINNTLLVAADNLTTPPQRLALHAKPVLGAASVTRKVSLNEEESAQVCVTVDLLGAITGVAQVFKTPLSKAKLLAACAAVGAVPLGPKSPKLGVVSFDNVLAPTGIALGFEDDSGNSKPVQVTMADNVTTRMVNVSENPVIVGGVSPIEEWDIYNFTVDAHPIHLHEVEFNVISRTAIPGAIGPMPSAGIVQANEKGGKDTVLAYPGEITKVRTRFDIPGLYVWHCHIVEHEDNEMMRPFVISSAVVAPVATASLGSVPLVSAIRGTTVTFTASATGGSVNKEYKFLGRKVGVAAFGVARAFAPVTTWNWNTTTVALGDYEIQVYARNVGSVALFEAISPVMTYSVIDNLAPASVALVASPVTTAVSGTNVTFTATPAGGGGALQYQFWGRRVGALSFSQARAFTVDNNWIWNTTGAAPGVYEIEVYAREASSSALFDVVSPKLTYTVTGGTVTSVSLVADNTTVIVPKGTVVTLTANGIGTGPGAIEYQFWGRKVGAATFGLARNYSTVATWAWNTTGAATASYEIQVYARKVGSVAVSQAISPSVILPVQ